MLPLMLVTVAFVASLACAPSLALAQAAHGGSAGSHAMGGGHPAGPRPMMPHGPGHRPFFRGPFAPGAVIAVPGVVYGGPYDAYGPTSYSDQSGFYGAPVSYDSPAAYGGQTISMVPPPPPPPPPSPPTPSVVEYSNGRSELRGDGVTTPYRWVWIPNPPPPPPSGPPSAPEDSTMFRFKDDQGEVHWTNRWSAIPKQYQGRAERLPL